MLLYGAGGHAKVIIDCLKSQELSVRAVFDDDTEKKTLLGIEVIHDYSSIIHRGQELIVSIGDNQLRKKIVGLIDHGFGSVCHASAIISDHAVYGIGTVVCMGAVIQSGTRVGDHVIVNTSAIIEHDAIVNDYVHIGPGAVVCGNVTIGEGVFIGANATILPGVVIGDWSVVGAGSVITSDIENHSIIYGNPGKIVRKIQID